MSLLYFIEIQTFTSIVKKYKIITNASYIFFSSVVLSTELFCFIYGLADITLNSVDEEIVAEKFHTSFANAIILS